MWLPKRQAFLNRLFVLDGLGGASISINCSICELELDSSTPKSIYRCLDCFYSRKLCLSCLLSAHAYQPFHRVEVSKISVFYLSFLTNFLALEYLSLAQGRAQPIRQVQNLRRTRGLDLPTTSPNGKAHHSPCERTPPGPGLILWVFNSPGGTTRSQSATRCSAFPSQP